MNFTLLEQNRLANIPIVAIGLSVTKSAFQDIHTGANGELLSTWDPDRRVCYARYHLSRVTAGAVKFRKSESVGDFILTSILNANFLAQATSEKNGEY